MGSVYSKIYSLLVYDLPIYGSRVACAFTSLIWLYCKDKEIVGIPGSLKLGIPRSHANHTRNPCPGPKGFPAVHTGFKYADSNLKAAWILGEWSTKGGDFKRVDARRRLLALQSALFMIGYKPLAEDAIIKP